jgi:hypothetical protein
MPESRMSSMSDPSRGHARSFVLEISGAGEAITLEPIGRVDREGALTLLEAVRSAQPTPLLEIRLDRITGYTDDAVELLARNDLPVLLLAS